MGQGEFFVLALMLCILTIQVSANNDASSEDVEDEYLQMKRFLFHKSSTSTSSSFIGNLVRPSTTDSPWPYRSTSYSTASPSSGACKSNSCEHGGICMPKGQVTYDCKCVGPWRGIYCGVADACYNLPCKNGGTCMNAYDDFWCKCTSDYYGKNCQSKFTTTGTSDKNCRPNICNTGRCISLTDTYYCRCPDDRYGENCEKRFSTRKASRREQYHQHKRNMDRQFENDLVEDENSEE